MARKYSIDLQEEIPVLEIKVPGGDTITLAMDEVYEYAMVDSESGKNLKSRINKITERFNQDNGCELSETQVYLLVMKGLEIVQGLVKN